jgi:hypothetical protein
MKKFSMAVAALLLVCAVSISSCKPANDRFTNNGNGTITDKRTGLVWLTNANPCGMKSWDDAVAFCNNLASGQAWLFDGSKAGDWRLPTKQELQGIGTDPPIAWDNNVPPSDWVVPAAPFFSVQQDLYWSLTIDDKVIDDSSAWVVGMIDGSTGGCNKGNLLYVWPVREDN